VEDAWAWTTGAEREVFVGEHRSELLRILKKIDIHTPNIYSRLAAAVDA
jgi:hypothetical protein